MASLIELRILETRLHSHLLEWNDLPLQNELLFLLDELQEIHAKLDLCNVPTKDINGLDMSLLQRVTYIVRAQLDCRSSAIQSNSYDCVETKQFR